MPDANMPDTKETNSETNKIPMTDTPRIEEKIFLKIQKFNQKGEELIHKEEYVLANKEYQKAWNTLPEPKQLWEAALWIKISQAEIYLALDDFSTSKNKLLDAMLCNSAVSNPLVHFLLAVCYFELGEKDSALYEFQIAYDLQGDEIFQQGDELYRDFLFQNQSSPGGSPANKTT